MERWIPEIITGHSGLCKTKEKKMQIKEMFEKQIDRDIKGVIKVGQSDEENVYQ